MDEKEIEALAARRVERLEEAFIDESYILDQIQESASAWSSLFCDNIELGKSDLLFVMRDQWSDQEKSEFRRLFKTFGTFNKLKSDVRKVIAEERNNKPDLIVRSLTGKSKQKEIDLRSDLVRSIAYQSQNDIVYQEAYKSAILIGFGAFEVNVEYESAKSFNQVIRYGSITDPTMVGFDPAAKKPHKGDGNFCYKDYYLTRKEFIAKYPYVVNPVSFENTYLYATDNYIAKDMIIVRDYQVKEWYPVTIYELSTGEIVTKNEWDSKEYQENVQFQTALARESQAVSKIIQIPRIVRERPSHDYKIRNYRAIQNQILEFQDWPSKQLKIIFVDGDSYWHEGRQFTCSLVREAKDAQRFLNFINSDLMNDIKVRRHEQFLGTRANIKGEEQMWRNPETQMGMLIAAPDPKTGLMPAKLPPSEVSQTALEAASKINQDMKEILGFSESSDMMGRDVSGKARRERRMEGSMSSYCFRDNLNQAIEQGGRVVLELLPHVIGKNRQVTITKKDGKSKIMRINEEKDDGRILNEISHGDYDIEIAAGPSFSVQKEIALEFLADTMKISPQSFPLIADLWAKNLDVQFMPQISDRFKTIVPKEIIAKEEGEPPPPPAPPSPEQQMMQMEMKEKEQKIQNDMQELKLRQEQHAIEVQKHELDKAKMILEAHKIKADMDKNKVDAEVSLYKSNSDLSGKIASILADHHIKTEDMKVKKSKSDIKNKVKSQKKSK